MRLFRGQIRPYLLLAPAVTLVTVGLGYGLVSLFVTSMQPAEGGGLTFANYLQLWSNPAFISSALFTLRTTLLATGGSCLLGLLLTRLIFRYLRTSPWRLLLWLPMLIPHFVAAYMVLLFLAQSGLISGIFYQLHLIADQNQFPAVTNDPAGLGIILAYIWKEVPFVVLMLLPVYYRLDGRYEQVVRTLGGSTWEVFKTAEWPWVGPVLIETGLILFVFISTAYEIPYLLGVTHPKALSVLTYQWFYEGDWSRRPLAMAAFVLWTAPVTLLSMLAFYRSKNTRNRLMRGR